MSSNNGLEISNILNNPKEDWIKIFLPSLILIAFLPFINLEAENIYTILVFMILDHGHMYSSFLESFFDKDFRKKRNVILYVLLAIGLNLIVTYLFPGNFFIYVFYLLLFHYIRQGYWLMKINNENSKLDILTYFFTFTTSIIFLHFRKFNLGDDSTYSARPIDFVQFFNWNFVNDQFIFYCKVLIGIIIFTLLLINFLKTRTVKINLITHTLLIFISIVLINNPYLSMALFAIFHSISFFHLYEKRIHLHHENEKIRKYSFYVLIAVFIVGGIIEAVFEDGFVYFPAQLQNLGYAMAFFPISYHVVFDFFEMEKENPRMKNLHL